MLHPLLHKLCLHLEWVGGQKNARFTTKKCKHGQMPKNANVICEGSLNILPTELNKQFKKKIIIGYDKQFQSSDLFVSNVFVSLDFSTRISSMKN